MNGLEIALLASVTMVFTDVAGTIMVMAESRNNGWLAGWMDTFAWMVSIGTTTITVTALQGNSLKEKILVITLVSAANLFGTLLGTKIGKRYVKDKTYEDRLIALENVVLTRPGGN